MFYREKQHVLPLKNPSSMDKERKQNVKVAMKILWPRITLRVLCIFLAFIYQTHRARIQKSGLSAFGTSIYNTEISNMSCPPTSLYMDKEENTNSQCDSFNKNFATKNHPKSLMHMFSIHCPNSQSSYPKVRVQWVLQFYMLNKENNISPPPQNILSSYMDKDREQNFSMWQLQWTLCDQELPQESYAHVWHPYTKSYQG